MFVCLCTIEMAWAQVEVIQSPPANTNQDTAETLKIIDRLVEQNSQLEEQNREVMQQIQDLRGVLARESGQGSKTSGQVGKPQTVSAQVLGRIHRTSVPRGRQRPRVPYELGAGFLKDCRAS